MLLFVDLFLKEVFCKGREYQWPRPRCCPRCSHCRVWGHGFVDRCFDTFHKTLLVKRYRCPQCHCVITCRPSSHFSHIQAPKKQIRHSICSRIEKGRWAPGLSSSRQRHWLANLKRKARAYLTDCWDKGLLCAYDFLLAVGHIPVSSAI